MTKLLLFFFLFVSLSGNAQVIEFKETAGMKSVISLNTSFSQKEIKTIIIVSSFELDDTLKIPEGKTLKFEPGCRITGKGTIMGGVIDAGYQQQIFDTSLTVNLSAVNQYFSVKWFGAKGNNSDDYPAIQKSINTCIRNNIKTLYLPAGSYKISKPLILRAAGANGTRGFCTLEILGESSVWDSNTGSEIRPSFKDAFAIGIQRGKGCKLRRLKITGLFKPPKINDQAKFYNTSFQDFTDSSCRDTRYSPYAAIIIDPFTNMPDSSLDMSIYYPSLQEYYGTNGRSPRSGSTATELEELSIAGFIVGICSSPNGVTRNAEITMINKIQFANCKLCISGGQDQEKDNTISNIYCWGITHTVFATGLYGNPRMAGNWSIDHVNIAGAVIRFILNDQHGYFPTYISHVYAESIGTWGTVNSEIACEISDCSVDFVYESIAGKRTLLTSWGENVVYRSCNFRFYGEKTALPIEGNCVFEHCYFSGPLQKQNSLHGFFRWPINTHHPFFKAVCFIVALIAMIIFIFIFKRKLFIPGRLKIPVQVMHLT